MRFFSAEYDQRSPADELFEGVLLAAQDSWEESKLRYVARIFAWVAFDSNVSREHANHLLQVADTLSYRQLVLLAMLAEDAWRARAGITVLSALPITRATTLA